MSTLAAVGGVWTAVKAKLQAALEADQEGAEFFEFSRGWASNATRAIVVVNRNMTPEEVGVKRLLGRLEVEFGCTARSADMEEGAVLAEALAYWLVDLFQDDPQLPGGEARTVNILNIEWEADPPVELDDVTPQDWVNVTVQWEIDYARA